MGPDGDLLRRMLRTCRPGLLLVDLPGAGTQSQRRPNQMCGIIESAARWSMENSIAVAVFAARRSQAWDMNNILDLRENMCVSLIDWCALGVCHPEEGLPVLRTEQVLSSFPLGDRRCRCPQNKKHFITSDVKGNAHRCAKASGMMRQEMFTRLSRLLLTSLSIEMRPEPVAESEPLPTNVTRQAVTTVKVNDAPERETEQCASFPTDARERDKIRRKDEEARTGVKHKPKPKPRTVEDGHDDCGDDLTGIRLELFSTHIVDEAYLYDRVPCFDANDHQDDIEDIDHYDDPDYHVFAIFGFPSVAAGADAPADEAPEPRRTRRARIPDSEREPDAEGNQWWKCKGCLGRMPDDHVKHSRTPGECKKPLMPSRRYECAACNGERGAHTMRAAECRLARADHAVRRGRHPRDPRVPAAREPTAFDRTRPPQPDEPEAADYDVPQPHPEAASSSAPPPVPAVPPPAPPADDAPAEVVPDGAAEVVPDGAAEGAVPGEGADEEGRPRVRRTWRDAESMTIEGEDHDWANWDLSRAARALKSGNEAVIRRTLRKLHVRWYHASSDTMRRLLRAAGCPATALNIVPAIVDTCRICRMWARPSARNVASTRVLVQFNQIMQFDLAFFEEYVIVHMICCTIKFTVAEITPSRETKDILDVITMRWIRPFGPPEVLESDREGALNSEEARVWAARWGFDLLLKPKNAKAWVAERHIDILKQQLRRSLARVREERVRVPFEHVLSECVLAKNIMLSVDGSSPYHALYGRVPRLLLDFEKVAGASAEDAVGGLPGISRHSQRVREIAVGTMVSASAQRRVDRAMHDKTRPALESLELAVGDHVDFYRKPDTKDISGWRGPAKVTNLSRLQEG